MEDITFIRSNMKPAFETERCLLLFYFLHKGIHVWHGVLDYIIKMFIHGGSSGWNINQR